MPRPDVVWWVFFLFCLSLLYSLHLRWPSLVASSSSSSSCGSCACVWCGAGGGS